jgi:hypothetical protein
LGERVTFEQAFPEIASVRIEVKETGQAGYGGERMHHYNEQAVSEYADCSNPLCSGGGITSALHP